MSVVASPVMVASYLTPPPHGFPSQCGGSIPNGLHTSRSLFPSPVYHASQTLSTSFSPPTNRFSRAYSGILTTSLGNDSPASTIHKINKSPSFDHFGPISPFAFNYTTSRATIPSSSSNTSLCSSLGGAYSLGTPSRTPESSPPKLRGGLEMIDTHRTTSSPHNETSQQKVDRYDLHERSEQGVRSSQEDAIAIKEVEGKGLFLGLFDGHCGRIAADFCQTHTLEFLAKNLPINPSTEDYQKALVSAVAQTESQFLEIANANNLEDGTTLLLCCITKDGFVHVAHCGDSRAIIAKDGFIPAKILTQDHKADLPTEASRVQNAGGTVVVLPNDCPRVNPGGFAFTRSIGDAVGKLPNRPVLSAEPEINSIHIGPHMKFLVMACDGVWDVLTSYQCADAILGCKSAKEACDTIVDLSLSLGTQDNVSVIVIRLNE